MNILHITATHLNPEGGVPVVLKELSDAQNRIDGVTSTVMSISSPVDNIQSDSFVYSTKKHFPTSLSSLNPDIVVLHSFFYVDYNWVVQYLKKKRIPYYIEPHGSFGKDAIKKSGLKKRIANATLFKKQIKYAKGFIFLNQKEMTDSIYRTKNDLIIPNGISKDKIKTNINIGEDYSIYFIGRYDIHHKGLDYLFDALDILDAKNYPLCIKMWGNGDEKTKAYLKSRAQGYTSVQLCVDGPIYGDMKNEQLESIGPMILTSRYEGFPMTVLEAWAYGNPCIVTSGTNVGEEVVNNGLGWLTQTDPKEIAETIELSILDYLSFRYDYILKCKAYVKDHYDWDSIAKQSIILLSENK